MEKPALKVTKVILIIIGILTIISCCCCLVGTVSIRFYNRAKQRNVEMLDFFNKGWIVHWAGYDAVIFESGDLMDFEALFFELELPYKFQQDTSAAVKTEFDEKAYYDLAETYLQRNTGRDFAEWALREPQYTLHNCQLGFNGPVTPVYQFIQINPDRKTIYAPLYEIGIVPWDHVIGSYEHSADIWWGEYDDELMRLEFIPTSAKEAYQVAQQQGGFAAVQAMQSQTCIVNIRLRYGWDDFWIIRYENEFGPFFTIRVDPDTGDWSVLQE
jgi:hypothetical protein